VLNATLPSGESTSLNVTSSFSGGTSPYTCQWLEKTPGSTSFVDMTGSPFTCTHTISELLTGPLTPAGTYNFELEVTDSTGALVDSNVVSVIVS